MDKFKISYNWIRNPKLTEKQIVDCVYRFCNNRQYTYNKLVITKDTISFVAYSDIVYDELVNQLVKQRYSDSEEFAILRKAINGITDEYYIYNAYVEECKVRAKAFISERESAVNG